VLKSSGQRPDDVNVKPELDVGSSETSARREHKQPAANRERRVRTGHPRIGGLLLALQNEPHQRRAWALGATGEERVARTLSSRVSDDVVVLHDRRIRGTRANIDHIAVAPGGVWVIDTKRYEGKQVQVQRPLLGAPTLRIGQRDETKLIHGLATQVALVETATRAVFPGAPIRGALCFVDADLPLIAKPSLCGCELLQPRTLAKRLNAPGPLSGADIEALAAHLARRFPSA
jgi:hypothetical protein